MHRGSRAVKNIFASSMILVRSIARVMDDSSMRTHALDIVARRANCGHPDRRIVVLRPSPWNITRCGATALSEIAGAHLGDRSRIRRTSRSRFYRWLRIELLVSGD